MGSTGENKKRDSFIKSVPWLYLFLQTIVFFLMVLFVIGMLTFIVWVTQQAPDPTMVNQTTNATGEVVGSMVG